MPGIQAGETGDRSGGQGRCAPETGIEGYYATPSIDAISRLPSEDSKTCVAAGRMSAVKVGEHIDQIRNPGRSRHIGRHERCDPADPQRQPPLPAQFSHLVRLRQLSARVAVHVALAIALREPVPATGLARIPWWAWSGGLFGAIFIGISILVAQHLGAAPLIALLVTGQMLAAIVLDHFGWLGLAQRPIDPARMIGVCLLVAGVVLIRR
jgi:transporter family-2 protein